MLIATHCVELYWGCMPPCGLVRRTVLWEMDPSLKHEKGNSNSPTAQETPDRIRKGHWGLGIPPKCCISGRDNETISNEVQEIPTILGMKFVSTYIYIEIYCASNIDQLRLPNCSRCCHSTLVKGPFLFSYRVLSLAILDSAVGALNDVNDGFQPSATWFYWVESLDCSVITYYLTLLKMVSWTKFGIGKGASEHPQVMRRKMEEDDIGHWALNQLVSGSVPSWNRQLFEYPMSMSMWFLMWWSSWGVDTHQPAEFNASKVPCPDQGEPGVVGKPCRFSKPHRGGGLHEDSEKKGTKQCWSWRLMISSWDPYSLFESILQYCLKNMNIFVARFHTFSLNFQSDLISPSVWSPLC